MDIPFQPSRFDLQDLHLSQNSWDIDAHLDIYSIPVPRRLY